MKIQRLDRRIVGAAETVAGSKLMEPALPLMKA
jgi:hypothetical protein